MPHTPGPWFASDLNRGDPTVYYKRGADEPAICGCGEGFAIYTPQPENEQFANARLIAAAPELLEALQMLREEAVVDTQNPSLMLAFHKAAAAIARAT